MAEQRIYKTADGRHVYEGDPAAAFLAYGVGDDVPAAVMQELIPNPDPAPKRKPGRPPVSKNRAEHEDK
ncbi:hypothetical protein OU415_02335 [Saccharopolyspora sp. WRP15-2]|uniref:Uncharacterized protein n=1 Tax=Saccharopolyspora oryzae TaxID=2997343 RepID=A0ABT4URB2_9PSEU|nr:hypothetical protein [Saccharopolyspora oryzae]MDA3624255.1 hypothetical protein [Saccharopolyspora oryzae]